MEKEPDWHWADGGMAETAGGWRSGFVVDLLVSVDYLVECDARQT